jgi:hypothetical protein
MDATSERHEPSLGIGPIGLQGQRTVTQRTVTLHRQRSWSSENPSTSEPAPPTRSSSPSATLPRHGGEHPARCAPPRQAARSATGASVSRVRDSIATAFIQARASASVALPKLTRIYNGERSAVSLIAGRLAVHVGVDTVETWRSSSRIGCLLV